MNACEVNFDGLVGPTHSYAGLAYGNIASARHRLSVSSPRQAALQALAKMKMLADLGLPQGILPPQERPDVHALRRLGFAGSDAQVLALAQREAPRLLAACASASSMWAANAATVSPSADAADGRVHLTPANLAGNFHRWLEAPTTTRVLRAIFADENRFAVHEPLPAGGSVFSDEGAANHTRLASTFAAAGVEFFVYGWAALEDAAAPAPIRFRGRQTLEASQAIARFHRLDPARVVMARQSQAAIDAGVFHNDVIAVGNRDLLFCHAQAWENQPAVLEELRGALARACGGELRVLQVQPEQVSLAEAVESYLFNSQLVSLPDDSMMLLCPQECGELPGPRKFLQELGQSGGPIRQVRLVDVRQSMRNGGGPACLRLRVVLTAEELSHVHPGVQLTPTLHAQLAAWIDRHYRDELRPEDLADPKLLEESRAALDALTRMLGLGAIYPFQL